MIRKLLVGVAAVMLCGVVGCSSSGVDPEPVAAEVPVTETAVEATTIPPVVPLTPPAVAPRTAEYTVPEYWWREDRPGYLTVIVPGRPDTEGIVRIMHSVMDRAGDAGGYFVNIDCGTGPDSTEGTRLGTSKFAMDKLGLAQTGLTRTFQPATVMLDGARCS